MERAPPYDGCGWTSDLPAFSGSEPRIIRASLQGFVRDASPEQIKAWDASIPWLQNECRELEARDYQAREYTAILEYELPRDFRRPDVSVLQRGCVVVLELKGALHPSRGALDQAWGYARDLAAYHSACAGNDVQPVLVTRGGPSTPTLVDRVHHVGPAGLDALLFQLAQSDSPAVSAEAFLKPDAYAPLPTIVSAARELFHKRSLPLIKRARAATEPALEAIAAIAHEAARTGTRRLVLLSGVPGSGKTLVGLQLVHAGWLDDLALQRGGLKPAAAAVYLSGNGPLVAVLQDALSEGGGGGRTFVQDIKKYVKQYGARQRAVPPEHLIVFDEAQRAHDRERVAEVHKTPLGQSEPEHLIEFCERIPEWSVLVALIGDGQAIHVGEEVGVPLWAQAVSKARERDRWMVHAAPALLEHFGNCGAAIDSDRTLSLDTEIRFHLTPKVHQWVAGLLGRAPAASLSPLGDELFAGGHRFLVTRDLSVAKAYLHERYEGAREARYGMLASSKDKWLPGFGVDNTFQTTKRLKVGAWYNSKPGSEDSCCALQTVATEFASQGLELDCALLAWGSDLLWTETGWTIRYSGGTRSPLRDPLAVRKNVYRVLLTRGRDGTVIFVPPDERMDETYARLISSGVSPLDPDRRLNSDGLKAAACQQ